ncbi:hypothetical protein HanIR_Chr12g0584441 [Helianthus annuus]|nr:hypothetical protein HanIR_Chr12g0584441 [Helianthus annuus]
MDAAMFYPKKKKKKKKKKRILTIRPESFNMDYDRGSDFNVW